MALMQTFTGQIVDPIEPDPETLVIHDIAHALSNLCRYTGHSNEFYSVAQHSVIVSQLLPPELKLFGLLHDGSEAYLGDVARPLKRELEEYKGIEFQMQHHIWLKFCGRRPDRRESNNITYVDNRVLATEQVSLFPMGQKFDWGVPDPYPGIEIRPISPIVAESMFLYEYSMLAGVPELLQPVYDTQPSCSTDG